VDRPRCHPAPTQRRQPRIVISGFLDAQVRQRFHPRSQTPFGNAALRNSVSIHTTMHAKQSFVATASSAVNVKKESRCLIFGPLQQILPPARPGSAGRVNCVHAATIRRAVDDRPQPRQCAIEYSRRCPHERVNKLDANWSVGDAVGGMTSACRSTHLLSTTTSHSPGAIDPRTPAPEDRFRIAARAATASARFHRPTAPSPAVSPSARARLRAAASSSAMALPREFHAVGRSRFEWAIVTSTTALSERRSVSATCHCFRRPDTSRSRSDARPRSREVTP